MACFLIPMTEAIVTTIVQKVVKKREVRAGPSHTKSGLTWSRKLSWLNKLLWGGTILLALEHVWHGEVVFYPPFLTAMQNPADMAPMFYEMATIGVAMAAAVTLLWGIIILIADQKARKYSESEATSLEDAK
jgi:hypothetical protein